MQESILTTGFAVVFTGIPSGEQRAQAVEEFLKGLAGVAPKELRWPSGSPVEYPKTSPGAYRCCDGITYNPGRHGDKLFWGIYGGTGVPTLGYAQVMQLLGLTYNNN